MPNIKILIYSLLLLTILRTEVLLSQNLRNDNYSEDNDVRSVLYHSFDDYVNTLYQQFETSGEAPELKVFNQAYVGFLNMKREAVISDKDLLTIIDFSLPSNVKRFWVLDMKHGKILYHSLVAHGRNTGNINAKNFSNVPESHMSSLGFYVTGETYHGKHNLSLRLDGVDEDYNSAARERAIVMHGASYVSEEFIAQYGRLGRSYGCPALPLDISDEIVTKLANNTALFIYYPDQDYESISSWLDVTPILQTEESHRTLINKN